MKKQIYIIILLLFCRICNGQTFFASLNNNILLKIDLAGCSENIVGNSGNLLTDIAICPDHRLYGITGPTLYEIDTLNASLTFISLLNTPFINDLVCDNLGNLLTVGADSLYQIDRFTGATTSLGYVGYSSAGDLTFYHDTLYFSATNNQLIKINLPVVSGQLIGTMNANNIYGLNTFCFNNSEIMVATGGNITYSNLYQVDPLTANLTLLCDTITHNLIFGAASINDINSGGCLNTFVKENSHNESVIIVPNPASTSLRIETNNSVSSVVILYDMLSKEFFRQEFTRSISLNIEQLTKGMYLYEVRNKEGLCKKGKVVKD